MLGETLTREETFTADAWRKRWEENNIAWHSRKVHHHLEEYWEKFCPASTPDKLVFVPLCGKTVDMRWMYSEHGCTVVGCELTDTAVVAFTEEHKDLKMTQSMVTFKNGKQVTMFHTPDKRLRVYVCDLFDMDKSPESLFKFIWDRGSLVAMDPDMRVKYVDYITTLAAPNVHWLLETVYYPEGIHFGPPCRISEDVLDELYAGKYDSKLLAYHLSDHPQLPGRTDCYRRTNLLTPVVM